MGQGPQESFYGQLKDESYLQECYTFKELEKGIKEYIDYYYNHRYLWNLYRTTLGQYRKNKRYETLLYLKGENLKRFSPLINSFFPCS